MSARRSQGEGGLVYSSAHGRMCPRCRRPAASCACRRAPAGAPAGSGKAGGSGRGVVVGRETQGRKGKGVTVVRGLPLGPEALAELARELKQRCGSGGTVRDGVIEIQGDHRDELIAALAARGFAAKRSGG